MLRLLLPLFLLLSATGCGPRYVDYFPYHDNGMTKPCVALIPLTDKTNSGYCWELSEELSQNLNYRIMDDAQLFLWPPRKVQANVQNLQGVDYFGNDLSFSKQFCPCEFVVVMELIEHKIVPYAKGKITPLYPIQDHGCNNVLMMKLRIRMIDLREDTPCVVLQEILQSNHMLPSDRDKLDYNRVNYNTTEYYCTPLSQAHQRMMKDAAQRIEKTAYQMR